MSRLPYILAASCLVLTRAYSVEMSTGSAAPTGLKPPERLAKPEVAPASDVWEKQARKMQVPEGFTLGLFAAEPLLANPVAFTIDEKGVMYLAESYRYRTCIFLACFSQISDAAATSGLARRSGGFRPVGAAEPVDISTE